MAPNVVHHSGTLVSAVLTATLHSYRNGQNSTPTTSKPLTDYVNS